MAATVRHIGFSRSAAKCFQFFKIEGTFGSFISRQKNIFDHQNKEKCLQETQFQNYFEKNEKLLSEFSQVTSVNLCYNNRACVMEMPCKSVVRRITEPDLTRRYKLPGITSNQDCLFPESISPSLESEEPSETENRHGFQLSSVLKKRRKKMNKHKYKKRIHRDKAKIRAVKYFRLRRKRRRQEHEKKLLTAKIKKVIAINPKSDLPDRPYVIHRLKNW